MVVRTLIHNARLIAPTNPVAVGWILYEGRTILAVGHGTPPDFPNAQRIDAQGTYAMPGFIDLHVHGGVGVECMDASPEVIQTLARFYAEHGVTSFLATTWTASRERIQAALESISACVGPQPAGATLLGAHLEGPYLNPARCGAQDSQQIRRADKNEAAAFLDTGVIRLLALAPEYEENHWLIRECVQRGITVSAAHTAATYEDMQRAVGMGLSHSTHTFNAMTGLNHRSPGTVGAVLSMPEIACELIADTVHVHPAVMKILVAAKGISSTILITDAVRGAGLPVGSHYEQDGRPIIVSENSVSLPDGTLAGSKLTMEVGVKNLRAALGQSLEKIWPAASLNAARAVGFDGRKGSLEPGKDADIVLVDEEVTVHMTIAEGIPVYSRGR